MVEKIKKDLCRRIREGTLEGGDLVPSVATLSERYNRPDWVVRQGIRDLTGEGVLTQKGGSTFVAMDGSHSLDSTRDRFALTYKLDRHIPIIRHLKEKTREQGSILTAHDGIEYNKHPELERELLKKLKVQGYKGAGLFASPVPPLNVDLYNKLRSEGMKVALLAPPQDNVTDQAVFLPDYRLGGYVIVKELAERDIEEICFVGPRDWAVYKEWILEGARIAADNVGVEVREIRKNIVIGEDYPTIQGAFLPDWVSTLGPKNALVTFEANSATVLEDIRRGVGGDAQDDMCVVCCFFDPCHGYHHLPRIRYDYALLLQNTVDYLLDDSVAPDTLVHEWIEPIFIPGHLDE